LGENITTALRPRQRSVAALRGKVIGGAAYAERTPSKKYESMKQLIYIKWFPPSWFQIKAGRHIIYIDPAYLRTNFAHYPKKIEYSKWPDAIDGLPEELEKADIILITHHHKDHCKKVTVNRLKDEKTKVLATKQCSKELGKGITAVRPGMEIVMNNIKVRAIAAYNDKHEGKVKLMHKKGIGVGYVITIEGKTIYHAGDTDIIPEMESLEDIDVALLPIGGRDFTMDLSDAVKAAKKINPKIVIPMHRFEADAEKYKKLVEQETSARVEVLDIGEIYQL
jgi:L-ascorbate metabolism protein UlaG (beta-lactamase superfamily)